MIDLTGYTAAELAVIVRDATTAYERRLTLEASQERVEEIAADYAQAVAGDEPIPHADLPESIGPGQTIIWIDGETYRNDSGAWLPTSASPDMYRLGWTRLTLPDLDSLRRWALGESYEAGEYVYHVGVIASAVQAHRADDPAWAPGMAGTDALWKIHGTIEPEPDPEPDPEPVYPAWVQPTRARDAYQAGDVVSFEGGVYQSTINGNVWPPSAYPLGWEKVA